MLLHEDRGGGGAHEGGKEGKKKDQTNLTRLQCRKQWSIVSLCGQLAQTGDLMYPH